MPEAAIIPFRARAPSTGLRLEGVTYSVRAIPLVSCISIEFSPAGVTVLLGPNGAGKSLLLRLIAGLIKADEGTIRFPPGIALPRDLAIVFQKPVLLRRTVRGNLLHALKTYRVPRRERSAEVERLLSRASLENLADQPARALSGGEAQRLATVRALAAKPKFLLLDEPSASLDPYNTAIIETLVRESVAAGTKVFMVTHDQAQAERIAGEICFLHLGRLIESAPAAKFLNSPTSSEARAYLAGQLLL